MINVLGAAGTELILWRNINPEKVIAKTENPLLPLKLQTTTTNQTSPAPSENNNTNTSPEDNVVTATNHDVDFL